MSTTMRPASSSSRNFSPDLWANGAQLTRKIQHQINEVEHAPAAADFSEYDAAACFVVLERLEKVARDGWWTAEGIYKLTSLQLDIVRLALRVKMRAEEYTGPLTAASLAHRFGYKDPRSIQIAIKGLEELEVIQTERQLRAIVELRVNNWFFDAERPVRRSRSPAGVPKVSAQKAREIGQRRLAQQVERFAHERAARAAARALKTNISSDHVLSKSLGSGRTPYPLSSAPAADAPPAGSPQPPLHDEKETPRNGAARPTNGIERPRQQGANDDSRRGRGGGAAVLEGRRDEALAVDDEFERLHGPGPPS